MGRLQPLRAARSSRRNYPLPIRRGEIVTLNLIQNLLSDRVTRENAACRTDPLHYGWDDMCRRLFADG